MTMAISQCPGSVRHTLTPIVNFNSGDVFSFEIKQRILKNNGSVLNNHSDERMSFMRQLEFFQKLNRQDALSYRALFIDAAASLLDSRSAWKDFIPFVFQFRVNVGVKMQAIMNESSGIALDNIIKLKSLGVRFWMIADDEWPSLQMSKSFHPYIDGVKIDSNFFEAAFSREDATELRRILNAWGGEQTIVHGLEHKEHFAFAVSNGFMLGQGTYCCAHPCH